MDKMSIDAVVRQRRAVDRSALRVLAATLMHAEIGQDRLRVVAFKPDRSG
jgi:hypothetical protein